MRGTNCCRCPLSHIFLKDRKVLHKKKRLCTAKEKTFRVNQHNQRSSEIIRGTWYRTFKGKASPKYMKG